MSARITQLLLVIGAVLLFVLLFFAPKIAPKHSDNDGHDHGPAKQAVSAENNANIDMYLNMASKSLEPAQKTKVDKFIAAGKLDSVVFFWDRLKRPDLASVYTEQIAQKNNKAEDWFRAGNRYYYSVQFSMDKTQTPLLYQCAMRCFSRGLKLEPANTDAKIMLASCFVEGSADPMQGISLLREVEKTDSNNVKLQMSFALFSVKSGQLDRAIIRFNKALRADSTYIEAYLHLADAYEQLGKIPETISTLEKYSVKTNDPVAKAEIDKYIQQLKK
jgi:cytochrome c-type biogenesis protein CcmH/NrfG